MKIPISILFIIDPMLDSSIYPNQRSIHRHMKLLRISYFLDLDARHPMEEVD